MKIKHIIASLPFLLFSKMVCAAPGLPLITSVANADKVTYSANIEILILMTLLTFLPALFMTVTPFLRVIIVLGLLRQAVGISQTPSNQILIGLSFFLTIFVMSPVFEKINTHAVQPYLKGKITLVHALNSAEKPLRNFMLNQTRKNDISFFVRLSGAHHISRRDDIPFAVLVPAYMTSELETAFQIGFILFIPFLIIDLIVSSTLMSMGMMMVSPMIISMPIKIMLFVMIDGWHLIFQTLANSFY